MTTHEGHFLVRIDTAANWAANNPILQNGEKGRESDTGKEKCGDGATGWLALPYDVYTDLASTAAGQGDSLLATLAPFANSAVRTQHDKNSDFVSITDFTGVDPTGATDSTAGFQAAVNSGKALWIPDGTYQIGNVTFGTAYQKIWAQGGNAIILQKTKGQDIFSVNAYGVHFCGLRFHGIETDQTNAMIAINFAAGKTFFWKYLTGTSLIVIPMSVYMRVPYSR